jgi:serine/threonine protein kinase
MAQLNAKHFLRRLSINTSSSNPSTSSSTASPTQGNGGGGAVNSPNSGLVYPLDGYKSFISKSKLASPRLYSEGPILADHGEDRTPTTPIAVPMRDFDRRASTPSVVAPTSLARGFDGRTSTTPMAVPTLSGRDFDNRTSTTSIAVPAPPARGFDSRAPVAPALSGRDFDIRAPTPPIAVPASLARGFEGHASTTPLAVPTPLARGFDGRVPTTPIPMPSSLARGLDGRTKDLDSHLPTPSIPVPVLSGRDFDSHTSTPSMPVPVSSGRDSDSHLPTPSIPVPVLPGRDFDGHTSNPPIPVPVLSGRDLDSHTSTPPIPVPVPSGRDFDSHTSTPSVVAPTFLANAINSRTSTPTATVSAPLSKGYDIQIAPPPIGVSTPPATEIEDGNSAPSMTKSTPLAGELEDGSPPPPITLRASPAVDLEGGTLTSSTAVPTALTREVEDSTSTFPTLTSTHPTSYPDSAVEEGPAQEDEPRPKPPGEKDAGGHRRSVSISFDPNVTLDNGHQYALEQPLPKPQSGIDIGLRGRSMLKELADEQMHHVPARAHSDSERTKYDPVTGEPVRHGRRIGSENMSQLQPGQSHYPLIQSTIDALARNSDLQDRPRMPSLTSEITASPLIEEVRTPLQQPAEYSLSPLGMYPHLDEPTSLLETSAWPTVPRSPRMIATHRSFSQSLDKRGIKHRSRRAQSDRSPSGTSMSPASAYLSMWVPAGKPVPSEPDDEGQEVGAYVIGKQIGFGGFSVVKEAFTIENDVRVRRAVKIVRKKVMGKKERENEQLQTDFEHEVLLWRLLNHRHILPLIAVYDTDFATFCFTQLNTGGTLFDLVRDNRKGLKSELAKRYSFQLASALRYLHEDMHVVHRDIKLENCLLDMTGPHALTEGGNLLLCDFGMAEFVTSDGTAETRDGSQSSFDNIHKNIGPSDTSTSIVGSLPYAAPERVNGSTEPLTTAVDMWAFGVVVFCLLTGDLPFQDTFQPRVPLLIMRGDWDEEALRSAQGAIGSEDMIVEVVRGCLQLDIDMRWNVGQVLASEWLENCKEEDEDGWKF